MATNERHKKCLVYAVAGYRWFCPTCTRERFATTQGRHGCPCGQHVDVRVHILNPKGTGQSRTAQRWRNVRDRLHAVADGRCHYCAALLQDDWTVDHRTPLARGGDNSPANMVAACYRCNHRKGSQTEAEFLVRRQGAA